MKSLKPLASFTSNSLDETEQIAKDWLSSISNRYPNQNEALIVGLSGHLGAGKTAFTKCLAKILGVTETITSPTFVIMKIYQLESLNRKPESEKIAVPWKRLIHIDAYRLERREELEALQWEQLVADKSNLILIEWPENVGLNEFEEQAHLSFDSIDSSYKITIK
jgi:tRNA threonylcarbamoyladenosine biosynthesis protein TsaE